MLLEVELTMNVDSYFSYDKYLKNFFGMKTYKVVVSSGLTCPTRDGSISLHGCHFCDLRGSSSYFGKIGRGKGIDTQIKDRLPEIRKRFGARKFLAYFQSYTNTYSDVQRLREMFTQAISVVGIDGLCIGTRPDCLSDSILALLEEIACQTYVSLELGVQSFENPTLAWLGRGHDVATTLNVMERLKILAPHVSVCVHLIFGAPTDNPQTPVHSAQILNKFRVHGVKLHQLMILKNTLLADLFHQSTFLPIEFEDYANDVVEFLENLSPHIYIERLYATATHSEECIAPLWSKQRWRTHNRMREFLTAAGCQQGKNLERI